MVKRIFTLLVIALSCLTATATIGQRPGFKADKTHKMTKKQTKENTVANPDFAFPKTVIDNAEAALRKASDEGDEQQIVQCAVQLVIANNGISTDRMPAMAHMLDSLAQHTSSATSAILYSLEARLYKDVYESDSYTFNKRTLPLGTYPADPQQWSEQLFAKKVLELVDKSLANPAELQATPLSGYEKILVNYTDESKAYFPTLYSLLADKGLDILVPFADENGIVIPFGGNEQAQSPTQQCAMRKSEIATQWYGHAVQAGNVAEIAVAIAAYCDNASGMKRDIRFNTFINAYNKYKDSPYSADLLRLAADQVAMNDKGQQATVMPLMEECIKSHPDALGTPALVNLLNDMKSGYGTLKINNYFYTKQEVVATAESYNMPAGNYVCIYKVPSSDNPYRQYKLGKGKFVISRPVPATAEAKADTVTLNFGTLPAGQYVAVTAGMADGGKPGLYGSDYSTFKVTDFGFNLLRDSKSGKKQVQLVNPMDGKPYAGQKLTFSLRDNKHPKTATAVTDHLGLADFPKGWGHGYINCTVRHGDDVAELSEWFSDYSYDGQKDVQGLIFTDLAIYHPGDTCNFAAVLYEYDSENEGRSLLAHAKLQAVLRNASYEDCDTIDLTTGPDGRATGSFLLPKGGMNGQFCIQLYHDGNYFANTYIRVEEYKQPTFYVELDQPANIVAGEPLKISGRVLTYSGMPVAGADAKLTIRHEPLWWRNSHVYGASYTADTCTDGDGRFCMELDTDRLKDTDFESECYRLVAVVTSQAGESQESGNQHVYIGSELHIGYNGNDCLSADEPFVTLTYNVTGGKGEDQPLDYTVTDSAGMEVAKGQSSSATLKLDPRNLPSGKYMVTVKAGSATESTEIILFRKDDQVPPTQTALWLPNKAITAPKDAKTVKIPVGSAFTRTNLFYTICNEKGVTKQGIILPQGRMAQLEVDAPSGERYSRVWVQFSTMDSCVYFHGEVTVTPAVALDKVKVEKLSFRDKIAAGGQERWTFRYTLSDNPLPDMPVLATMSDKSLNVITPFSWRMPDEIFLRNDFSMNCPTRLYLGSLNYYYKYGKNVKSNMLLPIDINIYGLSLYNLYGYRNLQIRGSRLMNSMAMPEAVPADEKYEEDEISLSEVVTVGYGVENKSAKRALEGSVAGVSVSNDMAEVVDEAVVDGGIVSGMPAVENIKYRPAEMPLAWFKPNLRTDSQGVLELSFDAPDFNTTWQLQMLGYNSELLANLLTEDIVASKPVMVSTNSPRFLRTGDRVLLMATVYNNSDAQADVAGRMEIFNPLDGKVIAFEDFAAVPVEANGSRIIALEFVAPSDAEFVGYRTLGTVPGFSDGEQSLIAIRPSSSPVTESESFYMAPAANTFTMQLPKVDNDAQVSLQYCDNPVWECVTALPDMSFDKDASILSTANRLYGNSIAAGLMKQYPQLAQAIRMWSEEGDSTLVSNLEKNPELKIVALDNTPWVLNAQAETLRKSRLVNLLDSANSRKAIGEAMQQLKSKQSPDGGWSWCPGMKSSVYITGQVLWRLAMLHSMGYLDISSTESMISRAMRFCEQELYQDYVRAKHTFSTAQMLNYLYIRSFFPDYSMQSDFRSLKSKALKAIKDEWKEFGIYNKATAATLLYREKEPMLARTILESLNQYASKSAERGMWFDNLRSGFFTDNTVITTAQALEAFAEITPQSPSIDMLRQWLIIERQAQDWGQDAQLAEVVYAILSTGSDWTTASQPARIYIGGTEISPSKRDLLTGSFTIPLQASQASLAELRVDKFGAHQAWGGVIAKYIAPIADVKEFSGSDVTVSKRILIVDENEDGISVRPLLGEKVKPGQRLRVQLTVTSERDIDYAVITDERGGCLAPVNQLSEYVWQDGAGFYREVRNDATNFFLPRLPKGDFILEYDCFASQEGEFAAGIATLQSLYAPSLSAHSAGASISVVKQ